MFFVEGFELEECEGADFGLELAVPVHEGALGDVELGGDFGEAPTAGAELDELVFEVVVIHRT